MTQQSEQYSAEQKAAVLAAVAAAGMAAGMAGAQIVNFTVWMRFLRLIFDAVMSGRSRAAWSARAFFDVERQRLTGLPRLDVPLLPDYQFDWFIRDMKPAYNTIVRQVAVVREQAKQGVAVPAPRVESTVRVAVAKIVADAGRDEMIRAVEADAAVAVEVKKRKKAVAESKRKRESGERITPKDQKFIDDVKELLAVEQEMVELPKAGQRITPKDQKFIDDMKEILAGEQEMVTLPTWGGNTYQVPKKVLDDYEPPDIVGWARVATGDETCAWCMMLVSRGPVYYSADSAGSALLTQEWLNEVEESKGVDPSLPMNEWHTGCDCTVMPVYDKNDWPGKDAADEALEKWNQAAENFEYDPDKKYRVLNEDGKTYRTTTLNRSQARQREVLNNLRFMLAGRDPLDRPNVLSKDQLDELLAALPGAAKLFKKELARRR